MPRPKPSDSPEVTISMEIRKAQGSLPERPWLGFLNGKIEKVDDHSMEVIRANIAKGRKPA